MAKNKLTKKKKKPTVKKKKLVTTQKKKTVKSSVKRKVNKTGAKPKKKKILAIPQGYTELTAYLIVHDASQAIEFYKKAFSAKETMRMEQPNGKVGHAELKIGNARIMLADEYPEMNTRSPQSIGGTPVGIHLYTKNVDETVAKAVAVGAKLTRPVEDMFYGDRSGSLEDPYGHVWYVSTHIEDVTPAQIRKRAANLFGGKY
ncbi:MAG: VOC family protein [Gammaproteobacteria bacterium]|nr:VOC family protein [Gammaproteobacteria bacterium]